MQGWLLRLCSFVLLVGLIFSLGRDVAFGQVPPTTPAFADISAPSPVLFIENVGQFDPRARFQVRNGMTTFWLTEDALWLTRAEAPLATASADLDETFQVAPRRAANVKLSFVGANPHPRLEPFNLQETVMHYYYGSDPARWHTRVPVWGGARYCDLYPGVDLVVGSAQASGLPLQWALEVHKGADLSAVRLQVEGAEDVALDPGQLRLSTSVGEIVVPLLTVAGDAASGAPSVLGISEGRFEVTAPYAVATSEALPLASQTDYSDEAYFGSYLGGTSYDWLYGMALSGQGDILDRGADSRAIWLAGWTASSDFPTEPGETTLRGDSDAFVTQIKRSALYVAPAFSAYIGGADEDAARDIVVGPDGNVYLTGWTKSTDFTTTANAFDTTHNGCVDAFALKMDSEGNVLYSTYLGGSHYTIPGIGDECGDDFGSAIAVDAQGMVYLTGGTASEDFPTTSGAYDRVYANVDIGLNRDVFVIKLNPAGQGASDLLYSSFVGGGFPEEGVDLAIDTTGEVYVAGITGSIWGPPIDNDFPITGGAFDTQSLGNDPQGFVMQFNPGGNGKSDLLYSSFLGADEGSERIYNLVLSDTNQVYVCGVTDGSNFPTTPGALDTTCGTDGQCDARTDYFVSQLNLAGQGVADLRYSTFLGGNFWEGFAGDCDIALGKDGDVYVTGDSSSTEGFPLTEDGYDLDADIHWGDMFVVRLRPQGRGASDLVYGTYVGGSHREGGGAKIALDDEDRVYVASETTSSDFPTTKYALYDYLRGGKDLFLFRILAPPPAPDLSTSTKTVVPEAVIVGDVVTYTVRLVNSGTLETTVSLTDTLPPLLVLQGPPVASAGDPPTVNGLVITWNGTVDADTTVEVTYAALVTATGTSTLVPPLVNRAYIDDGVGNVYVRQAFLNGYNVFLPLVLRLP